LGLLKFRSTLLIVLALAGPRLAHSIDAEVAEGFTLPAPGQSRAFLAEEQCPTDLLKIWHDEFRRSGWFTPAAKDACTMNLNVFNMGQSDLFRDYSVDPALDLEDFINSHPKTKIAYYPRQITRCLLREQITYSPSRGQESINARLAIVGRYYHTLKRTQIAELSLIKSIADYDNLLGKGMLQDLGSCGHRGIPSSIQFCERLKSTCNASAKLKAKGTESFRRLASQSEDALNVVRELEKQSGQKAQSALQRIYAVQRWLKPGTTYRKLADRGESSEKALQQQFKQDRADLVGKLRQIESAADCLTGTGLRLGNRCDSSSLDRALKEMPPYPKIEAGNSKKLRQTAAYLNQGECFLGTAEAVRLSNDTRQDLGVNLAITAVTFGAGAVVRGLQVASTAVFTGQALQSANALVTAFKIAPLTARTLVLALDAYQLGQGAVAALQTCQDVLHKMDGPIQAAAAREGANAQGGTQWSCPGSQGDTYGIARQFASDLNSCLLASALAIAPVAIPKVGGAIKNRFVSSETGRLFNLPKTQAAFVARYAREGFEASLTPRANRAFATLASLANRAKYFVHFENAFLKEMNNKDFSVATAVTNYYKELVSKAIAQNPLLSKKLLLEYTDYKSGRLVFSEWNTQIQKELEQVQKQVSEEFALHSTHIKMKDGSSLGDFMKHRAGDASQAKNWHLWGGAQGSDVAAEAAAREARTLGTSEMVHFESVSGKISKDLKTLESSRLKVVERFSKNSKVIEDGVLSPQAIEILRGARSSAVTSDMNPKQAADAVSVYIKRRFSEALDQKVLDADVSALLDYFEQTDRYMVGFYQFARGGLAPPPGDYIALDVAGLGPRNVAAAQIALKNGSGKSPAQVLRSVQISGEVETKRMIDLSQKTQQAATEAGVTASVNRSGDDIWLTLKSTMSRDQHVDFTQKLAEKGVGNKLRLMIVPERLGTTRLNADLKQTLAGDLSQIEKQVRLAVSAQVRDPKLRSAIDQTVIGFRLNSMSQVEMIVGSKDGLSQAARKSFEGALEQAVTQANKKIGTRSYTANRITFSAN
jgi:hypothetical protein